jgi:hypothetical protein
VSCGLARTQLSRVPMNCRHEAGAPRAVTSARPLYRVLIVVGNVLTIVGCAGLLLAATGLMPAQSFAIGISSGVRVIGSLAIAGCLLSAIGYGVEEYLEK